MVLLNYLDEFVSIGREESAQSQVNLIFYVKFGLFNLN